MEEIKATFSMVMDKRMAKLYPTIIVTALS